MKSDQIIVKGLRVFGYHGVNPEEKRDGQWFNANIIAETDLSAAAASDRLDDTVSYGVDPFVFYCLCSHCDGQTVSSDAIK